MDKIMNETFHVGDVFCGINSGDVLEVTNIRPHTVTTSGYNGEAHTYGRGINVYFKMVRSGIPQTRKNVGKVFRTNLSNAQRLLLRKVSTAESGV